MFILLSHCFPTPRYVGEFVQSILNGTAPTTVPEQLPIAGKGRPTAPKATQWVEAMDLAVEGLGWPAEAPTYGRLPARAVPDLVACGAPCKWIYNLSEDSSGVLVRFESNSSRLSIRVQRSLGPGGVMPRQDDIMSWNGRYGVDVYASCSMDLLVVVCMGFLQVLAPCLIASN